MKINLLKVCAGILLVTSIVEGIFLLKYKQAISVGTYNGQSIVDQKNDEEVVNKVSKLMLLPNDEKPVVGTIQDLNLVKDQLFFVNAQVGDKVLVYYKNKKAILYSPVTNKIIEVGPVVLNDTNTPATSSNAKRPSVNSTSATTSRLTATSTKTNL